MSAALGGVLAKALGTQVAAKGLTQAQNLGPALATQAITRMTPAGRAQAKLDKEARQGLKKKGPTAEDAAFRQALMQEATRTQGALQDRKTEVMKRLAAGGGLFTSGRAMQEAIGDGSLPEGTLGEIANAESARRAQTREGWKNRVDAKAEQIRAMLYDGLTKQKPEDKQAATAANTQRLMGLASMLGG